MSDVAIRKGAGAANAGQADAAKQNKKPTHSKTPSAQHKDREVVVHDFIEKKLKDAGVKAEVGYGSAINEDQTIMVQTVTVVTAQPNKAEAVLANKKKVGEAYSSIMTAIRGVNVVIGTKASFADPGE